MARVTGMLEEKMAKTVREVTPMPDLPVEPGQEKPQVTREKGKGLGGRLSGVEPGSYLGPSWMG